MPRFPTNGSSYRVVASQKLANEIQRLYKMARQQGRANQFTSALHKISEKLARSPLEFGELKRAH